MRNAIPGWPVCGGGLERKPADPGTTLPPHLDLQPSESWEISSPAKAFPIGGWIQPEIAVLRS